MPANGLSLSIFIGREIDYGSVLYGSLEFVDPLLLIARDNIQRREVAIDVNSEPSPLLLLDLSRDLGGVVREISDVTIRR